MRLQRRGHSQAASLLVDKGRDYRLRFRSAWYRRTHALSTAPRLAPYRAASTTVHHNATVHRAGWSGPYRPVPR
eukprot:1387539-Rhodomonas_salina.1